MAEVVHKYFCTYCNLYIFGETARSLASTVNSHNIALHPADFAKWTEQRIVLSVHYTGPSHVPAYLAEYVSPRSVEWGDAKPPDITERDKIFLERNGIKWD
jgi:hypothetical protein